MAEGLRFDPPRMEAKPGDFLEFQLENADISHQPHNFLIVSPGKVQEVVLMAMEMGESGPNKGYIPSHPGILASSGRVLEPEGKVNVQFTVPKEPGVYGYVCSVPGHGMIMYGALYVGVDMPPLSKDPNIPQVTLEKGLVGGGRRPFVQRFFMPNSGPASIAVALPGNQNFCFDAGDCRVRYVWSGPFMDGTRYWRSSGKEAGDLGDTPWWVSKTPPLRIGSSEKSKPEQTQFMGYTLQDGLPEFHYKVGKQDVYQLLRPAGRGVEMHFRLPGVKSKVKFLTELDAVWKCTDGVQKEGYIEVPSSKAAEFSVFLEAKASSASVNPAPASPIISSQTSSPHNH